jgi:hypothetical protein
VRTAAVGLFVAIASLVLGVAATQQRIELQGSQPLAAVSYAYDEVGWHGQDVRLLSCSTGCPSGTYAQELANDLGVTAQAQRRD